jgi:hypothetical protein
MTAHRKEFYESENGDRWLLVQTTDHVFVRHEANLASGGHITHIELDAFLSTGNGPEQQALLRLIGTLAAT